jgi:hypothetical protein
LRERFIHHWTVGKSSGFKVTFPGDVPSDPQQCRVLMPFSGQPDVSIWPNERRSARQMTQGASCHPVDRALNDRVQVHVEVKLDADLTGARLGDWLAQATAYCMHYMLRVFPMVEERKLWEAFPDRRVYVPLVSPSYLYIVSVDPVSMRTDGIPKQCVCGPYQGDGFIRHLLLWCKWAMNAETQLHDVQAQLNRRMPVNSWVPASVFNPPDPEQCIAMPSFYNPMWHDPTPSEGAPHGRVYRIHNSWWCANLGSQVARLVEKSEGGTQGERGEFLPHPFLLLFRDWEADSYTMSMPYYPHLRIPYMRGLDPTLWVIPVLEQLKKFEGWCHMDLRLANILVERKCECEGGCRCVEKTKQNESGNPRLDEQGLAVVHLIDFDFAGQCGSGHRKVPKALDTAPGIGRHPKVHPTSDMWSLAFSALLCMAGSSLQSWIREERPKEQFVDLVRGCRFEGVHHGRYYDAPAMRTLLAGMLACNQDDRTTIQSAIATLRSMRDSMLG